MLKFLNYSHERSHQEYGYILDLREGSQASINVKPQEGPKAQACLSQKNFRAKICTPYNVHNLRAIFHASTNSQTMLSLRLRHEPVS